MIDRERRSAGLSGPFLLAAVGNFHSALSHRVDAQLQTIVIS